MSAELLYALNWKEKGIDGDYNRRTNALISAYKRILDLPKSRCP